MVILFPIALLVSDCFKTKELPLNSKEYKFFHVLVTENPQEIHGRSSALILKTDILDEISKYKQTFKLQDRFYDVKSYSVKTIKKEVHENDTLTIGVLLSDFYRIQGYGSNFIKGDFYSRELKIYWIKKKEQVIINPEFFFQEKTIANNLFPIFLLITALGGIGRIVYLISQKVKFFT